MDKNKIDKIYKYNFEEIVLILMILASDLTKYSKDELDVFNEAIEGRIEVLFRENFLLELSKKYEIPENLISNFESLKRDLVNLYEPNWMKKLLEKSQQIETIKNDAKEILSKLKIDDRDPKKYSEDNLKIDW